MWRGFGNNNRNFFPLPISVPRAKGGEREGRGTWKIPLTSAFLARKPNYLHKFGWPIWRFVFLLRVSLATAPLTFLFNGPARASFFHFFFSSDHHLSLRFLDSTAGYLVRYTNLLVVFHPFLLFFLLSLLRRGIFPHLLTVPLRTRSFRTGFPLRYFVLPFCALLLLY